MTARPLATAALLFLSISPGAPSRAEPAPGAPSRNFTRNAYFCLVSILSLLNS